MLCPRCGSEWNASKGACTNCGLTLRTTPQSGSSIQSPNTASSSRGSLTSARPTGTQQQAGLFPTIDRQQGNTATPTRPQSGGLSSQLPPATPHTANPASPIPTRGASRPSQMRPDSARPAFEKPALRKVSPAQESSPGQPTSQAHPGTDSLAYNARVTPPPISQPGWSGVQQEIWQPTSQPLSSPQTPRPGMFSSGTTTSGNSQPLNAP